MKSTLGFRDDGRKLEQKVQNLPSDSTQTKPEKWMFMGMLYAFFLAYFSLENHGQHSSYGRQRSQSSAHLPSDGDPSDGDQHGKAASVLQCFVIGPGHGRLSRNRCQMPKP